MANRFGAMKSRIIQHFFGKFCCCCLDGFKTSFARHMNTKLLTHMFCTLSEFLLSFHKHLPSNHIALGNKLNHIQHIVKFLWLTKTLKRRLL